MKRLAIIIATIFAIAAFAAADKPTADVLVAQAKTKAAHEHKNIFVMFDASW